MQTRELIERIYPPFAAEVRAAIEVSSRHANETLARLGLASDTTSNDDCAFLYLLIRHFRRRHIFEVGTYIGTSALAMWQAAQRNGGGVTTCDPIDYGTVPAANGLRFLQGLASRVLLQLCDPIDFVFFDAVPDAETLRALSPLIGPDTIIATHDYLPGVRPRRWSLRSKGAATLVAFERARRVPGRWFLPEACTMPDGLPVNQCTAVFLPESALAELSVIIAPAGSC